MASVLYRLINGRPSAREDARISESMDRAHFKAHRSIMAARHGFQIDHGQASAGQILLLRHTAVGDVTTVTRRSVEIIRKDNADVYLICFPMNGYFHVRQNQRVADIGPGCFVLTYANEPVSIATSCAEDHLHDSFTIIVPSQLILKTVSEHRHLCGIAFDTAHVEVSIALKLLLEIYDNSDKMNPAVAEALAISAAEALLTSANEQRADHDGKAGTAGAKVRLILNYLHLHSAEHDVCAQKVANACNISPRYLHKLLSKEGRSFQELLWETRLSNARQLLEQKNSSLRTIAEIAYGVGFKHTSHFSRRFKEAYGESPKRYRARSLAVA